MQTGDESVGQRTMRKWNLDALNNGFYLRYGLCQQLLPDNARRYVLAIHTQGFKSCRGDLFGVWPWEVLGEADAG